MDFKKGKLIILPSERIYFTLSYTLLRSIPKVPSAIKKVPPNIFFVPQSIQKVPPEVLKSTSNDQKGISEVLKSISNPLKSTPEGIKK